jgi:hypothetical protein
MEVGVLGNNFILWVIPYENDQNPWRPSHRFDRQRSYSIRIHENKNFLEGF